MTDATPAPLSLAALVAQAYPSPEWAVFYEVGNATGFRTRRHADAVALGIWPSRGHTIVGFEFKRDRRDWLRERANPEKAEEVASHCDAWWLVVEHEKVATPEELPEPWGLYVANPTRTRLRVAKPCQFFDRDKAVMRRAFAAAMLRRVSETTVPKNELDRLVNERLQDAVSRHTSASKVEALQHRVDQLEANIANFEQASGLKIDGWRGPDTLGKAVSALLGAKHSSVEIGLCADRLDRIVAELRALGAEWPVITEPAP